MRPHVTVKRPDDEKLRVILHRLSRGILKAVLVNQFRESQLCLKLRHVKPHAASRAGRKRRKGESMSSPTICRPPVRVEERQRVNLVVRPLLVGSAAMIDELLQQPLLVPRVFGQPVDHPREQRRARYKARANEHDNDG